MCVWLWVWVWVGSRVGHCSCGIILCVFLFFVTQSSPTQNIENLRVSQINFYTVTKFLYMTNSVQEKESVLTSVGKQISEMGEQMHNTWVHIHTHTHKHTQTHTHTYTHTRTHTHTHTHTHAHTCTHTYIHTHAYTHTCTHTLTHTHTHAHTQHKHKYTHTHTHAHAHTNQTNTHKTKHSTQARLALAFTHSSRTHTAEITSTCCSVCTNKNTCSQRRASQANDGGLGFQSDNAHTWVFLFSPPPPLVQLFVYNPTMLHCMQTEESEQISEGGKSVFPIDARTVRVQVMPHGSWS